MRCALPKELAGLLPEGVSPPIRCGCITHEMTRHKQSAWCSGHEHLVGDLDYALRLPRFISMVMPSGHGERLVGRFMLGWLMWHKAKGPRPLFLDVHATWWHSLKMHCDELGVPAAEPPKIMLTEFEALRKYAKKAITLDKSTVIGHVTTLLQLLATHDEFVLVNSRIAQEKLERVAAIEREKLEREAAIERERRDCEAAIERERQDREAAIAHERQEREAAEQRMANTLSATMALAAVTADCVLEEPPLPLHQAEARTPCRQPLGPLQPQSASQPSRASAAPVKVHFDRALREAERRSLLREQSQSPRRTPSLRTPQSRPVAPPSVASASPQPSAVSATPPPVARSQPEETAWAAQSMWMALAVACKLGEAALEGAVQPVTEAVSSAMTAAATGLSAWLLEHALILHLVMGCAGSWSVVLAMGTPCRPIVEAMD